jgi:hypothetical protein
LNLNQEKLMEKARKIASITIVIVGFFTFIAGTRSMVFAQQPTPFIPTAAIATVTGTPEGPVATVNADQDQINVRECPNATTCAKIGVLLAGQQVPAKGRSVGGEWIMIEYPGVPSGRAWVHSSLVTLSPGFLPIIEPQDTPTPLVTSTIDPTLAAQFIVTAIPSRLPTFTPPSPLEIPTLIPETTQSNTAKVPMGMIITSLAVLGVFGALLSVIRGR